MTFDARKPSRLTAGRLAAAAPRGLGVATKMMIITPTSDAGRTRAS
jgi:hypothetical protein